MIFTPGHSPGHVTYSVRGEDAIFSGDVLFQGSVGRVDLPGGDGPTLIESIRTLVDSHPAETAVYPGHMGTTTLGAERATNPVPGRAGALAPPAAGKVAATMASKYQAPRGTFDVLPDAGARPGADRARRRGDLRPRRLRADRDAGLRGHRVVRARGRSLDRHRPQGDVHLRGQGRAQHHPAARGDGADLPRLPRARHAQAGAAGEALLRRAVLPPRAPAGGALPPVPPDRRRGDRHRLAAGRRRGDHAARRPARRARGAGGRAAARQPRLARGARAPTWRS